MKIRTFLLSCLAMVTLSLGFAGLSAAADNNNVTLSTPFADLLLPSIDADADLTVFDSAVTDAFSPFLDDSTPAMLVAWMPGGEGGDVGDNGGDNGGDDSGEDAGDQTEPGFLPFLGLFSPIIGS